MEQSLSVIQSYSPCVIVIRPHVFGVVYFTYGVFMIEQLKARIKEIESALEQSVTNHNGLLVRLDEAKHFLDLVTKGADDLAPESPVTNVLDVVDHVVDELDSASK